MDHLTRVQWMHFQATLYYNLFRIILDLIIVKIVQVSLLHNLYIPNFLNEVSKIETNGNTAIDIKKNIPTK